MSNRTRSKNLGFRYAPEDLTPRDHAADDAFVEAYIERNRDALNASIAEARTQVARGNYHTRDQVMADVKAQRQRRRTGKKK